MVIETSKKKSDFSLRKLSLSSSIHMITKIRHPAGLYIYLIIIKSHTILRMRAQALYTSILTNENFRLMTAHSTSCIHT